MKTTKIKMTAQEAAEYEEFKIAKAKKEAAQKKQDDIKAYNNLVDETIETAMPVLQDLSKSIAKTKKDVLEQFRKAIGIKADLFEVKDEQRTHTFTNSDGNKRITVGFYTRDDYRDTVEEGIAKVRKAIEQLGRDDESKALVQAVLRLLSRDKKGTLKASRILQLQKLADDSKSDEFKDGVKIIRDSYQPTISKQFIRAEIKPEGEEWQSISLGMTEA